ncbi:MAG: hypothetical protein AAF740_09635 [Bacteroidota bacterium]
MQKQLFFTILCCLFTTAIFAQRSGDDMKTLVSGTSHHGGFFAMNFKGTSIHDEPALLVGARVGWNIDRVIAIGFAGYGLAPTVSYAPEPNQSRVRPLMGYAGLFAEPIVGSNRVVHLTFPMFIGGGWAGYLDDWNDQNDVQLQEDAVIWVAEPGANLEINVSRWMRLGVGTSYRFVGGIDKLETSYGEDFQGMNYHFMMKFGRF